MYVSLKDIVKGLAQKKKLEWSGTREDKVWKIDNDFRKKRISANGAVDALKKEFKESEIDTYEYKDIEKQLK